MKSFTMIDSPEQFDTELLERLPWIRLACLVLAGLIAMATLAGWLIPPVNWILPRGWSAMHAHTALAILLSAAGLIVSKLHRTRAIDWMVAIIASALAVMASAVLVGYWFNIPVFVDDLCGLVPTTISQGSVRMSPQSGAIFFLIAAVIPLLRVHHRWATILEDLLVSCLCFLCLASVSAYMSGSLHLFSLSVSIRNAPQTLFCLVLLTFVAFWREAQYGFFSILLGRGMGSKIARIGTPFVLLLPFFREFTRIKLISTGLMRLENLSAIDTALTVMATFALLLFLAWRINGLERRIVDLSLRDELTGVYNRKGFLLLAGQGLQLAKRLHMPFSVMFIDLDGLKQINDSFGHDAGSALIAEIGHLLSGTFREADVIGRIGGDEFVIAGQLDGPSAATAIDRLREAAGRRNAVPGHEHRLDFSAGVATLDEPDEQSLDELLNRADQAMYREKYTRKLNLA